MLRVDGVYALAPYAAAVALFASVALVALRKKH
jgi:hypothetical protein